MCLVERKKKNCNKKRVDEISKTLKNKKSAFLELTTVLKKPAALLLRQSENYATDTRKFLKFEVKRFDDCCNGRLTFFFCCNI
jgi:hypothetical protein